MHTVQSLQCTVQSICPFGPHSILFPFKQFSSFPVLPRGSKVTLFSIVTNLLLNSASANKYIFTLKLSTFGQCALCKLTKASNLLQSFHPEFFAVTALEIKREWQLFSIERGKDEDEGDLLACAVYPTCDHCQLWRDNTARRLHLLQPVLQGSLDLVDGLPGGGQLLLPDADVNP